MQTVHSVNANSLESYIVMYSGHHKNDFIIRNR